MQMDSRRGLRTRKDIGDFCDRSILKVEENDGCTLGARELSDRSEDIYIDESL